MQAGEGTKATPQFETAEFEAKAGTDSCFVCHQPISGTYFRVNTRMACSACTERLRNSVPKDSHAAFVRALTFGAGAAIAGLVLYAVVGIATGLVFGYVSLAVGWMVGKAMMKGSGGLGGRRYQVAAVLFTYVAVSVAAIPIGIAQYLKDKKPQHQQVVHNSAPSNAASEPSTPVGTAERPAANATPPAPRDRGKAVRSLAAALGYLALVGLASPFLELGSGPVQGLIGIVILFVGIRIAWQMTRGRPPLVIDGPF